MSASFDLDLVIYSHSISSIAPHLLVACATQHSAVRLVDLKSGANTHSLVGHRGAVMTVAWSPTQEYILASGAADGTVLFWDIRMSSGSLEALDMENCIDITGSVGRGAGARDRRDGKAHSGAVNGLTWTDDGKYLATAGLDERIRVWDTRTAANTLVNFGPSVRNNRSSTVLPLIPPESVASPARSLLLFPSEREILVYELMDGRLVARLRAPGSLAQPKVGKSGRPPSNAKTRVNALQWKAHTLEVFSAHTDGQIRAWTPTVGVDDDVEGATAGAGDPAEESVEKKRRREALEDMYQDITQRKITFN